MNWVQAIDVALVGGTTNEPFLTMNAWQQANKKAISTANIEDEVQYGSFGIVMTVKTKPNHATPIKDFGPPGAQGWGYIHPPVLQVTTPGAYVEATAAEYFGSATVAAYATNGWDLKSDAASNPGMKGCLPANWNRWTSWTTDLSATGLPDETKVPTWSWCQDNDLGTWLWSA
jgi:hypothetical protein